MGLLRQVFCRLDTFTGSKQQRQKAEGRLNDSIGQTAATPLKIYGIEISPVLHIPKCQALSVNCMAT